MKNIMLSFALAAFTMGHSNVRADEELPFEVKDPKSNKVTIEIEAKDFRINSRNPVWLLVKVDGRIVAREKHQLGLVFGRSQSFDSAKKKADLLKEQVSAAVEFERPLRINASNEKGFVWIEPIVDIAALLKENRELKRKIDFLMKENNVPENNQPSH